MQTSLMCLLYCFLFTTKQREKHFCQTNRLWNVYVQCICYGFTAKQKKQHAVSFNYQCETYWQDTVSLFQFLVARMPGCSFKLLSDNMSLNIRPQIPCSEFVQSCSCLSVVGQHLIFNPEVLYIFSSEVLGLFSGKWQEFKNFRSRSYCNILYSVLQYIGLLTLLVSSPRMSNEWTVIWSTCHYIDRV